MAAQSLDFMADALDSLDPVPNENVRCAVCFEPAGGCTCFCMGCEEPLMPGAECPVCVPRCGGCWTRLCGEGAGFWDQGSHDSRDWTKANGELCRECERGEDIIARSAQITQRIRKGWVQ